MSREAGVRSALELASPALTPPQRADTVFATMLTAIDAPRSRDFRSFPAALLFAVGAILLTVAVYGFTLWFGFDYDDYHLLRPYTWAEVARTFFGPWDPSGVEVPFYRPLTAVFYAARFWVLGVDAWKYHALSLVMFAFAAALVGIFVARVTENRLAGALAVACYVLHPAMARSQVVWATNQMHLLTSLLVAGALVWWAARGRAGRGWGWAVVFAVGALLVKEDGIALLPLLVVLQVLWRVIVDRRAPWPPLSWVTVGAAVLASVLAIRYFALGGLGGYSARPPIAAMWSNYQTGIRVGFLLARTDGWSLWPWIQDLARASLAFGVLAAVLTRRARPGFLLLAGMLGGAISNLPFVFITKAEQYHLIASFAAIATAASLTLVWQSIPRRSWHAGAGVFGLAVLLAFATGARHRAELFTPYSAWTLGHDKIVVGWASVPAEIRDWLAEGVREQRQPAIARVSDLPVIIFGAFDYETTADGQRVRWIGERTEILPNADVRALDVPLAALTPIKNGRFEVVVESAGRKTAAFTLRDGNSTTVHVPVEKGRTVFPLSHRVTITVTPGWRVGDVSPGATDPAVRTIRMGELRVWR